MNDKEQDSMDAQEFEYLKWLCAIIINRTLSSTSVHANMIVTVIFIVIVISVNRPLD